MDPETENFNLNLKTDITYLIGVGPRRAKVLIENNIKILSNGEPTLREKPYPWARYAIYIQDPDGNVIEMTERDEKPVGNLEN